MFESSLLANLVADTTLTAMLPTFAGGPAIFCDHAPESAVMPFVVFRILSSAGPSVETSQFSVYFDVYDSDKSGVQARQIQEEIEMRLDRAILQHERYQTIRLFWFSSGPVPELDPRDIHRNIQFTARAGRQNWAESQSI